MNLDAKSEQQRLRPDVPARQAAFCSADSGGYSIQRQLHAPLLARHVSNTARLWTFCQWLVAAEHANAESVGGGGKSGGGREREEGGGGLEINTLKKRVQSAKPAQESIKPRRCAQSECGRHRRLLTLIRDYPPLDFSHYTSHLLLQGLCGTMAGWG